MRRAILFVCLGNICRSPLAEAAFRFEAERKRLNVEIDSAGIGGWHAGSPPDLRAQRVARRHGIEISHYRGRQIQQEDFRRFTDIFALDRQNLRDLQKLRPAEEGAQLQLLLDLVPGREGQSVADPYYGDESDFDTTWEEVSLAATALSARLINLR